MRLSLFSFRLILAVFSLAAPHGEAFEGEIFFRPRELRLHARQVPVILREAAQCLEDDLLSHQTFFAANGISAFYGDRSAFSRMSSVEQRAYVESLGKDPQLVDFMQPTSCVGLTLKCLRRGFEKAGQQDYWEKIESFTHLNAVDGTALQHALQKLGWIVLFWNPDISQNAQWDADEQAADPTNEKKFWGYHSWRWYTLTTYGNYYMNQVDDFESLIDFQKEVPAFFKEIPFFVGTAHTGYHVFPGTFGRVIEAHSTRDITDPQTVESAEFNPLAEEGAPRGRYRSGLFAIPPGY